MMPETPSRTTIGNRTRERPTASSLSPPGSPNGAMTSGASRMKSAVSAAEPEEHEPEERRGDAPGALALALLEQLAEDRDERGRERRVGDERAHEVRHLERDRERVDLPRRRSSTRRRSRGRGRGCARAGRDREDRCRPGEPPAAWPAVYAARPVIHAASIGTRSVGPVLPMVRSGTQDLLPTASLASKSARVGVRSVALCGKKPLLPSPGPHSCGHFHACRTSSSRRSGCAPPPRSVSRTSATARP